jgi:hypothetical protein
MKFLFAFLMALLVCHSAAAASLCFSVNVPKPPKEQTEHSLPQILILKDEAATNWSLSKPEDHFKAVDWVGDVFFGGRPKCKDEVCQQIVDRFKDRSRWKQKDNHLKIVLGDGFSGIILSLEATSAGYKGEANHYTDVPGYEPVYDVSLTPITCPSTQNP